MGWLVDRLTDQAANTQADGRSDIYCHMQDHFRGVGACLVEGSTNDVLSSVHAYMRVCVVLVLSHLRPSPEKLLAHCATLNHQHLFLRNNLKPVCSHCTQADTKCEKYAEHGGQCYLFHTVMSDIFILQMSFFFPNYYRKQETIIIHCFTGGLNENKFDILSHTSS